MLLPGLGNRPAACVYYTVSFPASHPALSVRYLQGEQGGKGTPQFITARGNNTKLKGQVLGSALLESQGCQSHGGALGGFAHSNTDLREQTLTAPQQHPLMQGFIKCTVACR